MPNIAERRQSNRIKLNYKSKVRDLLLNYYTIIVGF